jgi:hypothetical protein
MGADIHTYVEKKVNNKWIAIEGKNPYYPEYDKKNEYILEGWIYNDRNYTLFGILANVRNHDVECIAEPKGIPEDVSKDIEEEIDNCDLHSHSYFTLKELEEYNMPKVYIESGMVSKETREAYEKDGTLPQSWCGWTNSSGYEQMQWEQPYEEMIGDSFDTIINGLKEVIGNGDHSDVRFVFAFDN